MASLSVGTETILKPLGEPLITSLLDTDKYKVSMQQLFLHAMPRAIGRYRFRCRTPGVDLTPIIPALREQVAFLGELRFAASEVDWLRREPYLSPDYLAYLLDFRLDPRDVRIGIVEGQLDIQVTGPLVKSSPWEIYLLALVSELHFRRIAPQPALDEGRARLQRQLAPIIDAEATGGLPGFTLTEFGTRRRFSKTWQAEVVRTLQTTIPGHFFGTSNYALARERDLTAVGTMAHEYLQAWQALVHPLGAQKHALEAWAAEFRGRLGYALTDVIGMDAFCQDLDRFLANSFDGFRHDSGDPVAWGHQLIDHLMALGVDPLTKYALWSDALTVDRALALYRHFHGRIQTGFAIGTCLTNDLGYQPLNIVIKLVEVDGRPVAKLSDSPGKSMCEDPHYLRWLAASYGRLAEFDG